MCENKYYKQAREELAYLSGEENFQRWVESRAGFLMDQATEKAESKREGIAEGKAIGRQEGIAEGKNLGKKANQLKIAKKMKAKNMPIKEIIELTELTREEIEKL